MLSVYVAVGATYQRTSASGSRVAARRTADSFGSTAVPAGMSSAGTRTALNRSATA